MLKFHFSFFLVGKSINNSNLQLKKMLNKSTFLPWLLIDSQRINSKPTWYLSFETLPYKEQFCNKQN